MKIVLILLVIILGGVLLLEIGLRVFLGFGDPLLYVADQQIAIDSRLINGCGDSVTEFRSTITLCVALLFK